MSKELSKESINRKTNQLLDIIADDLNRTIGKVEYYKEHGIEEEAVEALNFDIRQISIAIINLASVMGCKKIVDMDDEGIYKKKFADLFNELCD